MSATTVLLTGIGGCIGTAVLERLRKDGVKVVGLAHETMPDADLVADFRDDASLAHAISAINCKLDGVVLAHGVLEPGPVDHVSPARWRRLMDINANSLYAIIHLCLPLFSARASIVAVSSTAAFDHSPVGGPHYTAGKWAVNGMVRHLAFDLGHLRNRVIETLHQGFLTFDLNRQLLVVLLQTFDLLEQGPIGNQLFLLLRHQVIDTLLRLASCFGLSCTFCFNLIQIGRKGHPG